MNDRYRIAKRVANTDHYGTIGHAATLDEAIEKAREVVGGESTGVRVYDTTDPFADGLQVVGV